MKASSSRSGVRLSVLRNRRRRMLERRYTTPRACSGLVRMSDDTELSVLNKKCGLIWLVRAARRASFKRNCWASSFFSLRVLFQILSGIITANIMLAYADRTVAQWVSFQIGA